MTLCDDGHEEVCYDGSACPICEPESGNQELRDAIQAVIDDWLSLQEVKNALEEINEQRIRAAQKTGAGTQQLMELLGSLQNSVHSLRAPWTDRDSYDVFCDRVERLGVFLNAPPEDRTGILGLEDHLTTLGRVMHHIRDMRLARYN